MHPTLIYAGDGESSNYNQRAYPNNYWNATDRSYLCQTGCVAESQIVESHGPGNATQQAQKI